MRFPIAMVGRFGLSLSAAGLVRTLVAALVGALVVACVAGCGESDVVPNPTDPKDSARATLRASDASSGREAAVETVSKKFVGSQKCVGCHVAEGEKWRGLRSR